MPEDVAYGLSKSGVDTSRDVQSYERGEESPDRQTDGFSSSYSRLVDVPAQTCRG